MEFPGKGGRASGFGRWTYPTATNLTLHLGTGVLGGCQCVGSPILILSPECFSLLGWLFFIFAVSNSLVGWLLPFSVYLFKHGCSFALFELLLAVAIPKTQHIEVSYQVHPIILQ